MKRLLLAITLAGCQTTPPRDISQCPAPEVSAYERLDDDYIETIIQDTTRYCNRIGQCLKTLTEVGVQNFHAVCERP